jgi:hypothetical protein
MVGFTSPSLPEIRRAGSAGLGENHAFLGPPAVLNKKSASRGVFGIVATRHRA